MISDRNPSDTNRSQSGRPKWWSILFLLGALSAASIPMVRAFLFETDHQFANLAGMGLGLLALFLFYTGLWLAVARSVWMHGVFLILPIAALYVFNSLYQLVGFTGETLPVFRSRWAKTPLEMQRAEPLQTNRQQQGQEVLFAIDPATIAFRSTQFLGNDRTGRISSPEFSTDWDVQSPKVLWKKAIGAGWSGFSVAEGLAITLEQVDEQESVTAFRLSDGAVVWQTKFPGKHMHAMGGTGPRSTPTIHQNRVLIQTACGIVACLMLDSGKVVWQKDLLELANTKQDESEKAISWGRSGSPLVIQQSVIVPFGGKLNGPDVQSLIALDLETGKTKWTGGKTQIAYASPMLMTLAGVDQIVSVNEGNATGHSPDDGTVLWETPWASKSNGDACASQPVAIDHQRLVLGKGYALGSKMIQLSKDPGKDPYDPSGWSVEPRWANTKVLKTKFTSAVFFEGFLFALSDGVLECVDPETGERRWRGGRYGQGQMIIVNRHILILSEDGRVVLLPASSEPIGGNKGPREIAKMPVLEGITWNVPTVAGPYVLVRNGEQAACLFSEKKGVPDESSTQPTTNP